MKRKKGVKKLTDYIADRKTQHTEYTFVTF